MKHYLLAAIFLGALTGCTKNSPDPAPAPTPIERIAGKWAWVSEVTVKTPKSGAAATTETKNVVPNTVFYTYGNDGKFTYTASGMTSTGTYTFDGTTLKFPGSTSPDEQVTTLTATQLVLQETHSDSQNTYATTDTYNR